MSFSPEAGDYLTSAGSVSYVERVETLDGQPRPRYWPGFQLVLRTPAGQVSTVPLPRGARPATEVEVTRFREAQDALSPVLPLDVAPSRTYVAPDAALVLF